VSAPVFLASSDLADLHEGRVELDGAEGRHAARVRRLGVGERIDLTDGAGTLAECVVAEAHPSSLTLDVVALRRVPQPKPRIVVVQALAKGDRAELAVETMTEVGVDVIVPWRAERCIARWEGEQRAARGLERWRTTAREAAKQARRAWLPEVTAPALTDEVCGILRAAALSVVLHEGGTTPLAAVQAPSDGDVVIVVGPEGGISPAELAAFTEAGAEPYLLGPTVLRTSTAGAVGAAVLLSRTARWSAT
jgi:16S rRNA (uracil1498-N3)-methyltransferase